MAIRKDIEKEFKEVIGDRIASICAFHNVTVDYAFQDIKLYIQTGKKKDVSKGKACIVCGLRRKGRK